MINLKNYPVLREYLKRCKDGGYKPKYGNYLAYFEYHATSNSRPCSRDDFQDLVRHLRDFSDYQQDDRQWQRDLAQEQQWGAFRYR